MTHRKATVVMIGACMLFLAMASAAMANEFYAAGTAREVQGADDLGKTVVHFLVVLGLPILSAGLIGGGLMRVRTNPGQGGASIGSGVAAGYAANIVNNLHADAAAAVSLASQAPWPDWLPLVGNTILLAALLATALCYARGRFRRVEAV